MNLYCNPNSPNKLFNFAQGDISNLLTSKLALPTSFIFSLTLRAWLKKISPRIKIDATILKKFDGTFRIYLSGEGITSISGESLNPEQLYAELIAEIVSANPNKELDILAFKDVQIQG